MKRAILAAFTLTLFSLEAGASENIWQRSKRMGAVHRIGNDTNALAAVENVLEGYGDELAMLRVRSALVDLARRKVENPRTVVALIRLRRELGLDPSLSSLQVLRGALSSSLSSYERSQGHYEAAHIVLGLQEAQLGTSQTPADAAEMELERALLFAWEPELRSEIYLFRAYLRLGQGQTQLAAQDFAQLRQMALVGRTGAFLSLGLAVIEATRGRINEADRKLSFFHEAHQASQGVSERALTSDLSLNDKDTQLLQLWLKSSRQSQADEHHGENLSVCSELNPEESSRSLFFWAIKNWAAEKCQPHVADAKH